MWAKWVGLDKNFEDLPPLPPTYQTFLQTLCGAEEIRTYMDVYGCDMRDGDGSEHA